MATTGENVLESIDALLTEADPTATPFVQAMVHGRLTRDELRGFAAQYFHFVDSLPRFVSTVHSVTRADADVRRTLLNVLVPLELAPPSVADLWLQTCAALGLFSDTVRASEPTSATAACLGDFEYLCQSGTAQGVAALYAWMHRLPRACRAEQAALEQHYGLSRGPSVQFFEVMGFQAQSHARALRGALAQLLERYPEADLAVLDSVRSALVAVDGMYSGALAGGLSR